MAGKKDPFAESGDGERTVIRPSLGGRRPAAPPQPFGPTGGADPGRSAAAWADPMGGPAQVAGVPQGASAAPVSDGAGGIALTGMNTLIAIATPLFSLISRIRNRAQHMDADKLRESVMAEVRAFENSALKAQIDAQKVKVARYALCATLDDVVLNTPWGGQSNWTQASMVATFHRETVGGDRFYDLLARLEQDPNTNIDLLEFLYMCLSLGFEGRLRVEQGGTDKHLQIRGALARIIRGQRGLVERDLSPHWKGVNRPHRVLSIWRPVWVALGATSAILALTFGGLAWALGQDSNRVQGQLAALKFDAAPELERRAPPPPPPPAPPPQEEERRVQIAEFLKPEVDAGRVVVENQANTVMIRLTGGAIFASASDELNDEFRGPITRAAEALKDEPGRIIVAGHSDSVPLTPGRFRDNQHLSLARAEAVMRLMGETIDPARITAEGRGDTEPIATNDTSEGRATNRRIEILLVKGGQ